MLRKLCVLLLPFVQSCTSMWNTTSCATNG